MEEERYTRITLRIPRDLHEKLQEMADRTSKSMNAEIIARLEHSFSDEQTFVYPQELFELIGEFKEIALRIEGNQKRGNEGK